MSRRSAIPQTRRHVHIFDEDWEFLNTHYSIHSPNPVGVSQAIRTIVHAKVEEIRAKQTRAIDQREK